MAATMVSCALPIHTTSVRISRNGVRAAARRSAMPSSSRGQLQIVAAKSWKQAAVETAAPLMVALATLMPASAYAMEDLTPTFVGKPEVDSSPLYAGSLTDTSGMTIIKVGGNVPESKTKVFYMALGVAFIYGCCYYGSTSDPFYDTAEYREDGGDGTSNWFYKLDSAKELKSREGMLAKLSPKSGEWDEFAELKK